MSFQLFCAKIDGQNHYQYYCLFHVLQQQYLRKKIKVFKKKWPPNFVFSLLAPDCWTLLILLLYWAFIITNNRRLMTNVKQRINILNKMNCNHCSSICKPFSSSYDNNDEWIILRSLSLCLYHRLHMNHGNCIEQPIDQIQRKDGSGIAFLIMPSS
jgi:hypothetical protein